MAYSSRPHCRTPTEMNGGGKENKQAVKHNGLLCACERESGDDGRFPVHAAAAPGKRCVSERARGFGFDWVKAEARFPALRHSRIRMAAAPKAKVRPPRRLRARLGCARAAILRPALYSYSSSQKTTRKKGAEGKGEKRVRRCVAHGVGGGRQESFDPKGIPRKFGRKHRGSSFVWSDGTSSPGQQALFGTEGR